MSVTIPVVTQPIDLSVSIPAISTPPIMAPSVSSLPSIGTTPISVPPVLLLPSISLPVVSLPAISVPSRVLSQPPLLRRSPSLVFSAASDFRRSRRRRPSGTDSGRFIG